jgi:ribosome-associated protein
MVPAPERPPPYSTDLATMEAESRVETFTAGGPGGQHRNKSQTGVRLLHFPSGSLITATERRSQDANKQAAFERLRERLVRLNYVAPPRTATRPSRGAVRRRIAGKQHMARKKAGRRPPRDED